jgi:hypothetical protein
MPAPPTPADVARLRTLHFLTHPDDWPCWPFLPVIRRRIGHEEELGVVYDALHASNLPGYSRTVFLANLFLLPEKLEDFLQLPHETFDTAEELIDAEWRVD